MIGYLNLTLRLAIWFLLTSDLSPANIFIGIAVCFLLPGLHKTPSALTDWLRVFWEIIIAVPQAYWEALQMMVSPHVQEEVTLERVKPRRTPGLIFLDIFLITFTPKTIVLKYHEDGWYEVHKIKRG
ncbi:Na+/H+ antiporter subunit E [Oxynema aestuarii]|jgi:multicomponent Na+:H+ antiporter subunit E|uniref:Na+/H+ antiporter subunit E n=1 Tax=Oxynema aestuarii AP17 TaxID=2064643 RepID=A0A6H1TXR4_9CYAN|nr:Na+/H+ antiporter subunit E [Oxynema aestuarii]QIZ70937.1 Na+/H+ antiporter subunit E [Oxynema aestuarii AP17]RMH77874.1 MAG: cation:proton antiporter [Cyanobacteria bacterium J007]